MLLWAGKVCCSCLSLIFSMLPVYFRCYLAWVACTDVKLHTHTRIKISRGCMNDRCLGKGAKTPGNGGSSWRPNGSGVPGQPRPSQAGTFISRGKFTMFKNPEPARASCVFLATFFNAVSSWISQLLFCMQNIIPYIFTMRDPRLCPISA